MTSISLLDRYIRFQILKCLNYLLQLAEFKVNRPLSAAPFTPKITNKYKMTINTDIYPLFSYLFSLFFYACSWICSVRVCVCACVWASTSVLACMCLRACVCVLDALLCVHLNALFVRARPLPQNPRSYTELSVLRNPRAKGAVGE